MNRPMIRQGDVLLVPIEPFDPTGMKRLSGRIILALGEATGHCHEVVALDMSKVSLYEDDQGMLRLRVEDDADASLVHQEHDSAPVIGDYAVVRQREWTDDMEPRNVVD